MIGSSLLLANDAVAVDVPPAAKVKILIVDGFSNHDWQQTTKLIKEVLDGTGLFDISVSTAPPTADAPGWDQWRPKFQNYDVVIQTCNDIKQGPSWPAEVQTAFVKFVQDGGGVYIFHSAQNAFAHWPAYNDIIALGWRGKDYGTALAISPSEEIVRIPPGEGTGTGHAPRGEVQVHLLGTHPIHEGMPREWKTPGLEVYHHARGPAQNVEVISYGRDPQGGENWPIEWTVTYGKGRVYIATFGHVWKGDFEPESMRCAGVQTCMVRALQWLAQRPVTYPVPKDFPTADSLSIRPPLSPPTGEVIP